MYPPVTQFETRHRMILDELRVREERQLPAGLPRVSPAARLCRCGSRGC